MKHLFDLSKSIINLGVFYLDGLTAGLKQNTPVIAAAVAGLRKEFLEELERSNIKASVLEFEAAGDRRSEVVEEFLVAVGAAATGKTPAEFKLGKKRFKKTEETDRPQAEA